MLQVPIEKIGLRVGLEIHQQLATNKKLFCSCTPIESNDYTSKFTRKLRASKSELGEYDPAALFESTKSQTIMYYSNPESSCLVEKDEEPPHEIETDAKKIALLIASSLNSKIFNEIYVMRKIVIDGSNTSGFQRTMLVSQGGNLDVDGKKIGVQSICLEEDAAKLLSNNNSTREYSLDRLGIPLVEIALEPVAAGPSEIKKVALTLGRLLRATKKVTRGLGSIRQDVNVSIMNGGVVEVKGVQQLDQLEKVVEYEAKRQHGLQIISAKLKEKNLVKVSRENDVFDITQEFIECKSMIIEKALKENAIIKAIRIRNFAGMFSFAPYEGIRLGKEIGQLVRFFGIGGVFHSDELPNYGIENSDIKKINKIADIGKNDGFLLIAAPKSNIDFVIESIINRIEDATRGVPAETRLATQTGETVYLRPRPGPSRMYPETDIPPIIVSKNELEIAKKLIPQSWDESISGLQNRYKLNLQLAEQIFDSDYLELFEKICENKKISPIFVASSLSSTITNLQRQGFNPQILKNSEIQKSFQFLSEGKISKESIEIIFQSIMAGKAKSVEEVIQKLSLGNIDESELNEILEKIILQNSKLIKKQGDRSIGTIMGIAMKELRGKADGEIINRLLREKINFVLNNKN
jgi:glutamyl-tRNA(Gln) amidotransferase subunit E